MRWSKQEAEAVGSIFVNCATRNLHPKELRMQFFWIFMTLMDIYDSQLSASDACAKTTLSPSLPTWLHSCWIMLIHIHTPAAKFPGSDG